jgi:hypothetical protein
MKVISFASLLAPGALAQGPGAQYAPTFGPRCDPSGCENWDCDDWCTCFRDVTVEKYFEEHPEICPSTDSDECVCEKTKEPTSSPTASPTGSNYGKITEGLCTEEITTVAECKAAATHLRLSWNTEGTWASHPKGCINQAHWMAWNKGGKWDIQPTNAFKKICKTEESYVPAPTSAPTSQYGKITKGLCTDEITTVAECKAAAVDLRHSWHTEASWANHPKGCINQAHWMAWNKGGKWDVQPTAAFKKICKTLESFVPAPTSAPTSQYGKITKGLCTDEITTVAECKAAAVDLRLSWNTEASWANHPKGCVNQAHWMAWNKGGDWKTQPTSAFKKICKSQSSFVPEK